MTIENHIILNHLDSPLKFLLWSRWEIVCYIVPFLIGICYCHVFLGLSLSFLNFYLYKKAKSGFFECFDGTLYWNLPKVPIFSGFPPSYIKMYVG